jgi:hypothetical protein
MCHIFQEKKTENNFFDKVERKPKFSIFWIPQPFTAYSLHNSAKDICITTLDVIQPQFLC